MENDLVDTLGTDYAGGNWDNTLFGIEQMVADVIAANPQSVEDFLAGKEKAIGFLVGQVMKLSKGKANPGMVNQLLKKKLVEK